PPTVKSVHPAFAHGAPFVQTLPGHSAAPPRPPLTSTERHIRRPPAPPGTGVHASPVVLPGAPSLPRTPSSCVSESRPQSRRFVLESSPRTPSAPRPASTTSDAKRTAGPHPSISTAVLPV